MLHPAVSRTMLWSSLAALMISVAPGTATAAENDAAIVIKSTTVRIADLDLSVPANAAALYRRIRRAAELVCGDGPASAALPGAIPQGECVQNAVASAVTRVNQPLLTDVYLRHGGVAASRAGA